MNDSIVFYTLTKCEAVTQIMRVVSEGTSIFHYSKYGELNSEMMMLLFVWKFLS